jgi:type I restriction enzyme S subunit
MSERWKSKKVKDLGFVVTGKTPSTKEKSNFGAGYPFIKPPDLREDTRSVYATDTEITEAGLTTIPDKLIPAQSTCVVCIGTIGKKIGFTTRPSITNQQINSVVVDKRLYDPLFIYYLLRDALPQLKQLNAGSASGRENVNKTAFSNIEVRVPSLAIQQRIAAILSAYDDLIENNLRRIKILEEMAQNLYREWFVKFHFPGHEQMRMVDSPLGKIPEGWEVVPFSEIYNTASGGTPSRKVPEYYGSDHPWIKTRELKDGFVLETEENITDLGLKKSSAKLFPANTVVIAMYGATIGMLGLLTRSAATNQACAAILPKEGGFGRAYAFSFLVETRKELIALGQGAAQQNISQVVIKKFLSLRPPANLVEYFSKLAEPMMDAKRNLQQRNHNVRQTRDLLLPKLISGELDVSELGIDVSEAA